MTVALKRGQIGRARSGLLLDVTAKSATGWATAFAPTWEMVSGHKGGTMGDSEYRRLYGEILDAAGEAAFERLWQFGADGTVKLLCYCPDGRFCHTHLLVDYAVKRYPKWFSDGRTSGRAAPKGKVSRMRYLMAVDLETTGLKPGYHEITQMAAIMLDKGLRELGAFETLVRIEHPERGTEGGFNVFEYTGLKLEDIQKGLPARDALRALETFARSKIGGTDLKQVIMFGQNPTFDKGFLEAAFEQQGWKWPFDFHVFALESMFAHHHLLRTGELPADIGLKDICKVAGVENRQKHNAMSDIRATVDALHKLCPVTTKKTAKETPRGKPTPREIEAQEVGVLEAEFEGGGPFDFDEPIKPTPRRRNVAK
jgi:DNA polymerase III epsilon subunit-like protein/uncharacterized protein YeaO (DUF488 family)